MKKVLFISMLCLFAFACKDKTDPPAPPDNNGTMVVIKDGVTHNITTTNNTLLFETQAGKTGRRLDIRCEVEGYSFILTVANWDFQNPPDNGVLLKTYDTNVPFDSTGGPNTACEFDGNVSYCDGGLATYLVGALAYLSEEIEDEGYGKIVITANDATNRRVSGTFDVITKAIIGPEKITFTGTFTDLKY